MPRRKENADKTTNRNRGVNIQREINAVTSGCSSDKRPWTRRCNEITGDATEQAAYNAPADNAHKNREPSMSSGRNGGLFGWLELGLGSVVHALDTVKGWLVRVYAVVL
jgi:hypothetical protein